MLVGQSRHSQTLPRRYALFSIFPQDVSARLPEAGVTKTLVRNLVISGT